MQINALETCSTHVCASPRTIFESKQGGNYGTALKFAKFHGCPTIFHLARPPCPRHRRRRIHRQPLGRARVRAFVRYNSCGYPGLLSMLPHETLSQLEVIAGDLRALPAIQKAARGVTHLFHLGALIAIPYSYIHPIEVIETNVIGTPNVLLAARESTAERVIHTSTSEVYATALRVPIDEQHPLQGQSPYSASKIGRTKLSRVSSARSICQSSRCVPLVPTVRVNPRA